MVPAHQAGARRRWRTMLNLRVAIRLHGRSGEGPVASILMFDDEVAHHSEACVAWNRAEVVVAAKSVRHDGDACALARRQPRYADPQST